MTSRNAVTRLSAVLVALGVVATAAEAAPRASDPLAVPMARTIAGAPTTGGPAGLHPADITDAYGLSGGVVGGTVGVVIPYDTPELESDLARYRSTFGLPACTTANGCFRKVDQDGGTSYPAFDAGWSLEASLDVQAVSAACPSCRILVVETASAAVSSLGTGVNTAVALGAQAVSMSWGAPETADASVVTARYFTHQGVALVAATGDSGYPQATIPATLPTVIAVGGTTLSRAGATGAAQRRAADSGIEVANGDATRAAGITPERQHLATLAAAKTALRTARAGARAAA
ncbi:hypothetical protein ACFSBI_09350, partial [Amnibacterium endophyticum]